MPGKTSKQNLPNQQVLTQILQRLERLDQNVAEGFKNVDRRFEQIDQRFEQIDRRFEQVDQRFEQIDRRFEQVDQRFEQIDRRFEQGDQHIVQIEAQIRADMKNEIRGVLKMLPEIADDLLKRITAVQTAFSDFRDVSLMTWAEIKRQLLKEDEEHKQIREEAREAGARMDNLQQKVEAHEVRITRIESAQKTSG